jgi:hypothetical protein
MTQLTVRASKSARARGAVDSVVASLPVSLAPADADHPADLIGVDGTGDWPAVAAASVSDGAIGLVVVRPHPADARPFLRSAGESKIVVVVDTRWSAHPIVPLAAEEFRRSTRARGQLESRVVVSTAEPTERILLDQLLLLCALLGPVEDLALHLSTSHGYCATASVGGVRADLLAVRSDARSPTATVRHVTREGAVELQLPEADTVRPAHLHVTTPTGAVTHPTVYESAHRSSWRRLHALVASGQCGDELEQWQAVSRVVMDRLGPHL